MRNNTINNIQCSEFSKGAPGIKSWMVNINSSQQDAEIAQESLVFVSIWTHLPSPLLPMLSILFLLFKPALHTCFSIPMRKPYLLTILNVSVSHILSSSNVKIILP